ncbi:MTRF1L release factor glutamine methyltransferase [Spea bombifrons]|uniref:MTRF1L release factor glutamine methyltransferase n=1 Tax=Spea bombifrons TaxID=233779 RepID=UPI00234993E5|nr:MTRF1L release factor glutamine methyltransferase [Spea bombifrons]XP_053326356.1 MTRF1L release factor glutamine methyltransferase [Spea bombifrons]
MHVSCTMLCRLLPKSNHRWLQRRWLAAHGLTPHMLVLHWQKIFETHKVPEARESSEIIISHALGGKTLHGIPPSEAQRPVSASQLEHIESMGQQRLNRVPVQYVIGEWDFLDMTLQMRPPVFIPRPETEELVGLVLAESQGLKNSMKPRILEVGCGSGAVSLALLRHLPQSHVLAIDKTEAAVNLTRDNAERLGLQDKIHILRHDVMLDPPERLLSWGPVDAIVSNPPYIFTADMSQLEPEIFRYEDHNALDGGPDGMNVIQGILHLAPQLLNQGGDVFLEGDPRHPDMIHQWLQKNTGIHLRLISMVQDFCKKPRFVHLRKD